MMASCFASSQQRTASAASESDVQHPNMASKNARHKIQRIQHNLDAQLSVEARSKIQAIIDGVSSLNDVEKLLLYLQLPTGVSTHQSSPICGLLGKAEHMQASTWISSHLEEDSTTCMPKSEIYEDYKLYCERHEQKPVSIGDFNRVLRNVFPNVQPRRLGNRGQSRYCFSGIKSRGRLSAPVLPIIESVPDTEDPQDAEKSEVSAEDRVRPSEEDSLEDSVAASSLVCQWAQKLFSQSFTSIQQLAHYLVTKKYVNTTSLSAFTVLASSPATPKSEPQTSVQAPDPAVKPETPQTSIKEAADSSSSGSGLTSSLPASLTKMDAHRATTLKLQRKLQERATLNEQKKRLEEQRCQSEGKDTKKPVSNEANSKPKVEVDRAEKEEALKARKPATLTPQKMILPKTLAGTQGAIALNAQSKHYGLQTTGVKGSNGQPLLLLSPSTNGQPSGPGGPLVILSPVTSNVVSSHSRPVLQMPHPSQPVSTGLTLRPRLATTHPHVQILAPAQATTQYVHISKPPAGLKIQAESQLQVTTSTAEKQGSKASTIVSTASAGANHRTELPAQVEPRPSSSASIQMDTPPLVINIQDSAQGTSSPDIVLQTSNTDQRSQSVTDLSAENKKDNLTKPATPSVDSPSTQSPLDTVMECAQKIPGVPSSALASLTRKTKSTPSKPRLSGKTVSDLLREQRGSNSGSEKRGYVNDRRPVAQLLKESRQNLHQQHTLITDGSAATILAPVTPTPTNNSPFVLHALALSNSNKNNSVKEDTKATTKAMPSQPEPVVINTPAKEVCGQLNVPVSAYAQEDTKSQLKQLLAKPQVNNPKLRDLLTEKDDTKVCVRGLQQILELPSTSAQPGFTGVHKDLPKTMSIGLHQDLPHTVSYAGTLHRDLIQSSGGTLHRDLSHTSTYTRPPPRTQSQTTNLHKDLIITRPSTQPRTSIGQLHPDLIAGTNKQKSQARQSTTLLPDVPSPDIECELNMEVQDLCSKQVSISGKRAASEPPTQYNKRLAASTAGVSGGGWLPTKGSLLDDSNPTMCHQPLSIDLGPSTASNNVTFTEPSSDKQGNMLIGVYSPMSGESSVPSDLADVNPSNLHIVSSNTQDIPPDQLHKVPSTSRLFLDVDDSLGAGSSEALYISPPGVQRRLDLGCINSSVQNLTIQQLLQGGTAGVDLSQSNAMDIVKQTMASGSGVNNQDISAITGQVQKSLRDQDWSLDGLTAEGTGAIDYIGEQQQFLQQDSPFVGGQCGPSPAPSFNSHKSAASTPMSMLSPQSASQGSNSLDGTAFMPIHCSAPRDTEPLVSPVKPVVTGPGTSFTLHTTQVTTSQGSIQLGSSDKLGQGFMPYTSQASQGTAQLYSGQANTTQQLAGDGWTVRGLGPQTNNNANTVQQFAPASSIKPVKRGKCRGKGKITKGRQRHHSAQDPLSMRVNHTNQILNSNGMSQLGFSQTPINPAHTSNIGAGFPNYSQSISVNIDQPGHSLPLDVNANAPAESPFSPEIQDIMYNNWMESTASTSYRSHSVPVQYMLQGTSDSHDFLTGTDSKDDFLDTPAQSSEITSLLQDKMQEPRVLDRGLQLRECAGQVGARKNLTSQLLEGKNPQLLGGLLSPQQGRGLSCVGRGDYLISGAPFRPPLCYAFNTEEGKAAIANASFQKPVVIVNQNDPVPTPPSSQNPTPDYSNELTGVAYEVNQGMPGSMGSSAMDTPNSLEPMTDPLLSSVCDESGEVQQDLQPQQGVSFAWD